MCTLTPLISSLAAIVTAPAGGTGALVTLGRHAPKLLKFLTLIRPAITKLVDAASHFIDVRRWFDKLIDSLKLTKAQKWCFIAGTPVMTMAGPLPIEQIEPGMMVWSAPECGTGQAGYRPVLETYRNRAPSVWHVSYDHDADPATADETLGASAEHPVWVEETASFLPAADLRPGMTLRMAGGHGGTIASIRHETSRSPAGIPVFNFAVAEHHTYFAGIGGVWVHNLCSEALERYASRYDILFDHYRKSMPDDQAWKMALDKLEAKARRDKLNWVETNEALGYIAKHSQPSLALWDRVIPTKRGEYIEAALSKLDYGDWGHIAQTDRWWPVVDFIKDQNVISVKSCDTRQASDFITKLKEDADKLRDLQMTNANVPIANKILDIRVEPGGSSHAGLQQVRAYAEGRGLEVRISEFP